MHGSDGLDEITTTGETRVSALVGGAVQSFVITPEDFGLKRYDRADLRGGDRDFNAKALVDVLDGKPGAYRDTVLMNAGAGLVVAGKANSLGDGIEKAAESIDSGKAAKVLAKLQQISNA